MRTASSRKPGRCRINCGAPMLTPNWTRDFPGQQEILSYLTRVSQEYRLYQHIRFCSTAESATLDDELKKWNTHVTAAKGSKKPRPLSTTRYDLKPL